MRATQNNDTLVLHTGNEIDGQFGALSVPIYQVSTFLQDSQGNTKGYEYSRAGNPTRTALEQAFAVLEHGKRASAFGSGLAAISAVFMLWNSGDHVVVSNVVYGGTYRLLTKVLNRKLARVFGSRFRDASRQTKQLGGLLGCRRFADHGPQRNTAF